MKDNTTKKIVFAALLAALACVATMIIKIPTPLGGYIHAGDAVVVLAGFLLGPVWGALAAGLGSGLADVISGYVLYAPGTFVIKAVVALLAGWIIGTKLIKNEFAKALVAGIPDAPAAPQRVLNKQTASTPSAREEVVLQRNKAVAEYRTAHKCDFNTAWCACRSQNPELFAD